MSVTFTGCAADEFRDEFFLYVRRPDGSCRARYGIVSQNAVDPDAEPGTEVVIRVGERVTFNQRWSILLGVTGRHTLVLYVEERTKEVLAESEHPYKG